MVRSWAFATAGLIAFGVLVWFAGPLFVMGGQAPLMSPSARLTVIALFAVQYLAQKLWNARRARANNDRVVEGLAPAAEPAASSPELGQLRERFATALADLRRMRFAAGTPWQFGRSYLYQLPWYVIIGAPGAGKTTALLNSGLDFPLAEKLGRGAVGGFGGTRNCDWWFTDRAVLIDTAGRYTTHESDRTADRQGWEAFLQLLLRTRPRCPLNGVLVAISVSDLLGASAEEVVEHGRVLKARLDELQTALRVRLPVYVLLTKCDLLPGFVDWFGALSREERDQVWGVTFDPRNREPDAVAAGFASSFDRLVDHLTDLLLGRLHAERDPLRRARIAALPNQLRSLRGSLEAVIRGAFGAPDSSLDEPTTLLRGVYLTSGTQSGTPIDRMLSAFGREMGLERQILPPNQNTGKSFFLAGLLNDVVLAETQLGGHRPAGRSWLQPLLIVSLVMMLGAAAALGTWWVAGYAAGGQQVARFDGDIAHLHALVSAIPSSASTISTSPDSDPRPLLASLDAARHLADIQVQPVGKAGVFDIEARSRAKTAAAARAAYDRLLLGPFQERIALAIDTTMRSGADVNVQYEALKAYQLLTDPAHFDAAGIKVFVLSYWDSGLTPAITSAERAALSGHLDALLDAGAVGSGVRLEPALVESVRARLASQSVAQRIELRVTTALNSRAFPDFAVASLGPAAAALFAGPDRVAEPTRVPARYTLDAYGQVVSKQVPMLARQLSSEAQWVLGAPHPTAAADVAEVMATYRVEYALAWVRFVDDLRLKPAANNRDALQQAQSLAQSDGPLALLVESIVRETPVRMQDGSEGPIDGADPLADRFLAWARYASRSGSNPSALEDALQSFKEIQTLRTPGMKAATGSGTPTERMARVSAGAQSNPEPVRGMLLALAVLPPDLDVEQGPPGSEAGFTRQIAAKLGAACIRTVAGHFPFDRRAAGDATFDDFAHLFGPKGSFDQVFQQLLGSRVETSLDSWEWIGKGAGPSAEDLERFRSAARIRDVFFPHADPRPALQLTFRPVDMDDSIDRFQLTVDGQTVKYAHGPIVPTVIRWPGTQGGGKASVELTPTSEGALLEYNGPWALLRLMDHAAIQDSGSPGHFRVVFTVGGRRATFDVESDSGANPFRLRELEQFACPIPGR
ncbi:MAG TPA: type VI secretion system membrane subunit TssM [Steroidobacteraceae bacterium]|nr:type VI secretion system membrane subunit TssM [Steroidobacteraceae bacterium]